MSSPYNNQELREVLRSLIESVNKWKMYVPSAEAEAEINHVLQLLLEDKTRTVINELKQLKEHDGEPDDLNGQTMHVVEVSYINERIAELEASLKDKTE